MKSIRTGKVEILKKMKSQPRGNALIKKEVMPFWANRVRTAPFISGDTITCATLQVLEDPLVRGKEPTKRCPTRFGTRAKKVLRMKKTRKGVHENIPGV
jgi:hypothetical protein